MTSRCACGKFKRSNQCERYTELHARLRMELEEERISASMPRIYRHREASQQYHQTGE